MGPGDTPSPGPGPGVPGRPAASCPPHRAAPRHAAQRPSSLDQVPSGHPGPRHWTVQAPICRRARGTGLAAQSPRGLSPALPGPPRPEQPRSSSRPPSHQAWSSHQAGGPHTPRGACLPEVPWTRSASLLPWAAWVSPFPPALLVTAPGEPTPRGLTPPAVSSPQSANFGHTDSPARFPTLTACSSRALDELSSESYIEGLPAGGQSRGEGQRVPGGLHRP